MTLMVKRSFCRRISDHRAFTLVELLVTITIIAMLAGLGFPAISAVINAAKKSQARTDAVALVNAIQAYNAEYGMYPLENVKQGYDTIYGNPGSDQLYGTEDIITVLTARDEGVNQNHQYNPKEKVFLEVRKADNPENPRNGIGEDNKFYDPWGNEYIIMIDGNYDGKFDESWFQSTFKYLDQVTDHGTVAVWSYGKDGMPGNKGDQRKSGSDDVTSW